MRELSQAGRPEYELRQGFLWPVHRRMQGLDGTSPGHRSPQKWDPRVAEAILVGLVALSEVEQGKTMLRKCLSKVQAQDKSRGVGREIGVVDRDPPCECPVGPQSEVRGYDGATGRQHG